MDPKSSPRQFSDADVQRGYELLAEQWTEEDSLMAEVSLEFAAEVWKDEPSEPHERSPRR